MNAIVVLELRRYVTRLVVIVNLHPRFTARKASVRARVPLPGYSEIRIRQND